MHPAARALLRDYIGRRREVRLEDEGVALGSVFDILTWRHTRALSPVRDGDAVPEPWKRLWADMDALYEDAIGVVRR